MEEFSVVGKLMDQVHELVQYHLTDGLRVDTPKRIRKNLWPEFSIAAFAPTLSEVLINDTNYTTQR